MTTTLQRRESASLWEQFCQWVTSTENRLYVGWLPGGQHRWIFPQLSPEFLQVAVENAGRGGGAVQQVGGSLFPLGQAVEAQIGQVGVARDQPVEGLQGEALAGGVDGGQPVAATQL